MFWASSIPTKAITFNFSSLASTLLPFYFGSRQHSWSPTDSETSFSVSSVRNPHIGTSLPGSLTCYSRRQYFPVDICSLSLALPLTWCVPPFCCHCKRFRIRRPSSLTCVSCQRFTDMETCYLSYLCPLTILALPDNFRLVWQPANGYTPLASFHNFRFCQNRVSLFECKAQWRQPQNGKKNGKIRPKSPNWGSPIWQKFPHFPFFSSFQSGTASLKILAELDWVKILVCASSLSVSWLRAQWNMECFENKKRDYVMTEANKYREVGGIRMGGGSLCYLFQPVCIQRS